MVLREDFEYRCEICVPCPWCAVDILLQFARSVEMLECSVKARGLSDIYSFSAVLGERLV